MKLEKNEINSPLWEKISEHYTAELAKLRERLESTACKPDEREHICWRIQEIKGFLSMAEPEKRISPKIK